ncbi:MAG: hypothetical protein U0841_35335 [Chloroflexia bacterium]
MSSTAVVTKLQARNRLVITILGQVGARVTLVVARYPAQLAIISQPDLMMVGRTSPTPFVVEVRDVLGNRARGDTSAVTVSDKGGRSLQGTTLQKARDGIATFADLGVDTEGQVDLRFALGTVTQVDARPVRVVPQVFTMDPTAYALTSDSADIASGTSCSIQRLGRRRYSFR